MVRFQYEPQSQVQVLVYSQLTYFLLACWAFGRALSGALYFHPFQIPGNNNFIRRDPRPHTAIVPGQRPKLASSIQKLPAQILFFPFYNDSTANTEVFQE